MNCSVQTSKIHQAKLFFKMNLTKQCEMNKSNCWIMLGLMVSIVHTNGLHLLKSKSEDISFHMSPYYREYLRQPNIRGLLNPASRLYGNTNKGQEILENLPTSNPKTLEMDAFDYNFLDNGETGKPSGSLYINAQQSSPNDKAPIHLEILSQFSHSDAPSREIKAPNFNFSYNVHKNATNANSIAHIVQSVITQSNITVFYNKEDDKEHNAGVVVSADLDADNGDGNEEKGHSVAEDNLMMAWWVQLCWTTVFIIMILVAIGGNCIVMWIVIAHKRMRTVTNYFLVNLSCADLLLSTLNCFFNFIYMLQRNWQFGAWYCTVNNFIANTTVAASVFTLTAMCCDRHFAIVHPLHPRMSKITAIVVIVMIWILSMTLASPCLLFSTTVTYSFNKTACILIWPDGQPTDSTMDFGYQVLFLVITYIVPMALMSFFYTSIGKVLWGSESIGERTQMQLDAIRSKRKVVKMIIFIVLVFAICWLPYHAYFIYTHFDRSILYTKYVQHVYLAFYWFAMANAMVNPLIYYWMNAKFRGYFRRAICCWRSHGDLDFEATFNGRTFKSTRADEEETRISLRHLKHSSTCSTTAGTRKSSR